MDELFFGVKRKKTRRSPARKTRRSPKRKTTMCNKKLSLPKLRKLAVEHGVNIFSEAKTAISKRTGMPKKPKMVGCSTLMKRLKEAGLSELYTKKMVEVMPEVTPEEIPVLLPEVVQEDNAGYKAVSYGNLVGVLIEAIKEQQSTINSLVSRIEKLEKGE